MNSIPISEATMAQLREFATNVLGLQIRFAARKEEVLAMIQTVHSGDTITVAADKPASVQDGPASAPIEPDGRSKSAIEAMGKLAAVSGRADPKVTIIIQQDESEEGSRPVFVSNNGTTFLIERGKEQIIPYRFLEPLRHAMKVTYHVDPETGERSPVHQLQYPFQIIKMPSDAEIAAWHRATDHLVAA